MNVTLLAVLGLAAFLASSLSAADHKTSGAPDHPKLAREKAPSEAKSAPRHKGDEFRPQQLTPEQREAKRKEFQNRLQMKVAELRAKRAKGDLDPAERKKLDRLEHVLKRCEAENATRKSLPTDRPGKNKSPVEAPK